MARVSVVIPTYNRLPTVKDAIESVLNQTYRDFEFWVVDDGSTDGTGEALRTFGDKVKYVSQNNRGVSAARNLGLRISRGKYLAFLDSDDLWEPQKLEIQVKCMEENPQFPLCYTDEVWIRGGTRVNPKKKHAKYSGWIFEKCLPLCIISPSSALMKRSLFDEIGGFDETLPVCEDYDLWLRVTIEERRMALGELVRKCHILSQGCCKRGKVEEGKRYEELAKRYGAYGERRDYNQRGAH
jgi:glycosyltransferase involved in cell wall biosynthesis